jgi:protein-S-isoprenylcysteine O-methyltransferase Ste14
LTPLFQLGMKNAWLLCLPFLLAGFIGILRKDVAKRMSDMTGYTARERFFTIAASLAPYPFMIATAWTPFSSAKPLLCFGLAVYVAGLASFASAISVFIKAPLDEPFTEGVYRISRNPLYVSTTMIFLGICLTTANVILFAYLIVLCVPQHFMILAEERICRGKFGASYEKYTREVPRYLLIS